MLRTFLALLVLVPNIITAQDNPNYNPDYDADGCYSISDILGLLPQFGVCPNNPSEVNNGFSGSSVNFWYDPDFNGDGCYSAIDVIGLLPLFGNCWACGDPVLFDSLWYGTVSIGNQCWFTSNLQTTAYANGDLIQTGMTGEEWASTTEGATAVVSEDYECDNNQSPGIDVCDGEEALSAFGRLYNGYAVEDARGLCPSGWQVPADSDWLDMELQSGVPFSELFEELTYRGTSTNAGNRLKSTDGWLDVGMEWTVGTDEFQLTALPGGLRNLSGDSMHAGALGYWWSSTGAGNMKVWTRTLSASSSGINRTRLSVQHGLSVRCLREAE